MNSHRAALASRTAPLDGQPAEDVFVEYDGTPLVELAIDEAEYRLDVGKQGTALGISRRAEGTYDWEFLGEVRWDGSTLRSRALERPLLEQLGRALAEAVADAD